MHFLSAEIPRLGLNLPRLNIFERPFATPTMGWEAMFHIWKIIPRGRRSQKPKFLRESMNQNWNFQKGVGGGGVQTKKTSLSGVWIFSGTLQ